MKSKCCFQRIFPPLHQLFSHKNTYLRQNLVVEAGLEFPFFYLPLLPAEIIDKCHRVCHKGTKCLGQGRADKDTTDLESLENLCDALNYFPIIWAPSPQSTELLPREAGPKPMRSKTYFL